MPGPRRRRLPPKPPPHTFDPLVLPAGCGEKYAHEWFLFGFDELREYLGKHAAFDDYYLHSHDDFNMLD